MSAITPTITTNDPHVYREQMELIASYADGVHLDFSDGIFAPTKLLPLEQAWRDERLITHAHIMLKNPLAEVESIVKLDADLVILHAESDAVKLCLESLLEKGVRTGIALLPETPVSVIKEKQLADLFDHVLIFGGHLGYQGGTADLSCLSKVSEVKVAYSDVEISWDGGVNNDTAEQIARAGVDILNTGGYLKQAENPKKAYDTLVSLVQSY